MTKENLIKLLRVMRDQDWRLHESFKRDRKWAMAKLYLGEGDGYDTVIDLLTDPDYAQTIWELFIPDEPMEKEAI